MASDCYQLGSRESAWTILHLHSRRGPPAVVLVLAPAAAVEVRFDERRWVTQFDLRPKDANGLDPEPGE